MIFLAKILCFCPWDAEQQIKLLGSCFLFHNLIISMLLLSDKKKNPKSKQFKDASSDHSREELEQGQHKKSFKGKKKRKRKRYYSSESDSLSESDTESSDTDSDSDSYTSSESNISSSSNDARYRRKKHSRVGKHKRGKRKRDRKQEKRRRRHERKQRRKHKRWVILDKLILTHVLQNNFKSFCFF